MSEVQKKERDQGVTLKVTRIGNSVGLILPKDLLARLRLSEGDLLHVIEEPERSVKLTPFDPTYERGLDIARKAFKTYAETFRALAK